MDDLKCMGEKCPQYHEHEFRLSFFICGLDNFSYKKDAYKERPCGISQSISEKYAEISELKLLADLVEENQN